MISQTCNGISKQENNFLVTAKAKGLPFGTLVEVSVVSLLAAAEMFGWFCCCCCCCGCWLLAFAAFAACWFP